MQSKTSIQTAQELKNKGYKFSNIRVKIMQYLQSSKTPLTPSEIIQKLLKDGLKPNKTTVYRELEMLSKEQIVSELTLLDGKKRYEHSKLGHHHHLICNSCNKIECVKIPEDLEKLQAKIEKQNSFKIQNHLLEFFGLCQKCQLSINN